MKNALARNALVLVASLSLLTPTLAMADDGHGRGEHHGPPSHQGSGHYDHPGHTRYYPGYRYYGHPYAPYGYYYGHAGAPYYYYDYGGHGHHDHDNDDALWAIGGFIVGAVIGTAVERSQSKSAPPPPASAPVPSGPPAGCRDVIVYDSNGNPRVQRDCD